MDIDRIATSVLHATYEDHWRYESLTIFGGVFREDL
jgi:hypothetical protein